MDLLAPDRCAADDGAGDVVGWARCAPLLEVEDALTAAAAALAAGQARLGQVLAVFAERRGHERAGVATLGHWASINLGQTSRATGALAAAGAAAAELPALRAAWESGALSTDKARLVASVADAASEAKWVQIAVEASAGQLARIASTYRRATTEPQGHDATTEALDHDERCGVSFRSREDGLVEILALLEPADAALVRAALDTAMERAWRTHPPHEPDGASTPDAPAPEEPARAAEPVVAFARRRLEALLDVCETAMASGPLPMVGGERTQVVLHVDAEFLAGHTDTGICHVGNGHTVDRATAECLACDGRIVALLRGTNGQPVDLGRSQRTVSDKQRRLLNARDHSCRFPGCTNERFVDAHHVLHWTKGGRTDMNNLLLLCRRHHRQHHKGLFRIIADGKQGFAFVDAWGRSLGPPRKQGPPGPLHPAAGTPRARSGGDPHYSLDLTVTALAS